MPERRSTSGQHGKVEQARRVAREALGGSAHPDQHRRYVPAAVRPALPSVPEHTEYVLTIGEVAGRLGTTRGDVERLIKAGKLRELPTGFTVTVPTTEVERLREET